MARAALCLTLLLSSFAHAADVNEKAKLKARQHYEAGITHYNLGEFAPALAQFKEAYREYRDAGFLFNIAQCYRRLDDPGHAAEFYRAYRREAPKAPNGAMIDKLIVEMDKAAAEKRAVLPPTGPEASETIPPKPEKVEEPAVPPVATTPPPAKEKPTPVTKKWWLWTAVGGVVIVGLAVGLGVGLSSKTNYPNSSVPPLVY